MAVLSKTQFSVTKPRKSRVLTGFMALYLIYTLVPLVWLVINASKTQPALFSTSGLSFGGPFALFDNIGQTFSYNNGIFFRWLGNTLLYVVVGAGGAASLSRCSPRCLRSTAWSRSCGW